MKTKLRASRRKPTTFTQTALHHGICHRCNKETTCSMCYFTNHPQNFNSHFFLHRQQYLCIQCIIAITKKLQYVKRNITPDTKPYHANALFFKETKPQQCYCPRCQGNVVNKLIIYLFEIQSNLEIIQEQERIEKEKPVSIKYCKHQFAQLLKLYPKFLLLDKIQ